MSEALPKGEGEKIEAGEFLSKALSRQGELMARYSVGQTPVPDWREVSTDGEIARMLSEVKVDDPYFGTVKVGKASAQELFEAGSLTVAKAKAMAQEAPREKRGLLDTFADKITRQMGAAIASKAGKRGLAATAGLALVATACGEAAGPVEPTVTPEVIRPTATEVAPTATVEPTRTSEPTPTPEVFTGNPSEVGSWPERYQNYFAHPNPESWQTYGVEVADEQFDNFLNEIRRNYLQEAGVPGAEDMGPEQLLWAMIEESAREKREIILSITEIMRIREENAGNTPYMEYFNAGTQDYARYGLWQTYLVDRDLLRDPLDAWWVSHNLQSGSYQASIFGREMTVRGAPSLETTGDLAGVVLLPGELGRGVLIRVKDVDLQWHLGLYQVSESPVQYDETMRLCWVFSDNMHFTTCPTAQIGGLTLVEGWSRETRQYDYPMANLAQDWLQWPPVLARVRTTRREGYDSERNGHIASFEGWIHPVSGLEIIDFIGVAPYDEFHNAYDITPPFSPLPGS